MQEWRNKWSESKERQRDRITEERVHRNRLMCRHSTQVCVYVCVCFSIFRNVSKHLWLNQHDIRFGENMWCTVIQHRAVSTHRDTQSANCEGGLISRTASCLCGLPLLLFGSFPNIIEFFYFIYFLFSWHWVIYLQGQEQHDEQMCGSFPSQYAVDLHYGAVCSAMLIFTLLLLLIHFKKYMYVKTARIEWCTCATFKTSTLPNRLFD